MYCIWCDTETGEAVHYKRSGGVMSWDMIVNEAGEKILATEWRQHPAPLRVVRV